MTSSLASVYNEPEEPHRGRDSRFIQPYGIRINAVNPGTIRTPILDPFIAAMPEFESMMTARHPIGRLGRPEEIAEAVVWLCSDAASFVIGQNLPIDGGYTVP